MATCADILLKHIYFLHLRVVLVPRFSSYALPLEAPEFVAPVLRVLFEWR